MVKPYTWEEIKKVLLKKLKKTKHILTYGTIGSCNVENDIDTIITKKPNSKSSDFFREIHNLFDSIDNYLQQKHNAKLIRTSRFSDQEETKYIANFKNNDLVFHILTYVSFKQIEIHWHDTSNSSNDERIKRFIKENYSCILGNYKDLFKSNFKTYKNEYLFIYLNDLDKINSHFPTKFLIHRMDVLFDYLLRKELNLKSKKSKNEKEIRENFYKICDILDKTEKQGRFV